MLLTLAFRHLWVRKLRSLFLLLGFALGVGVMVVLLSVGEAMLDQSRDVSLVGGGEVTVLPQGIDVEAMRTGGLGGMFFAIDRARFLTRQVIGGPRHAGTRPHGGAGHRGQAAVPLQGAAPAAGPAPVRAGGEIPSRAAALGAGLDVRQGAWRDSPADSAYVAPTAQQLYDELDRFHLPRRARQHLGRMAVLQLRDRPRTSGGMSPTWSAGERRPTGAGADACSSPTAGRTAATIGSPARPPPPAVRLDTAARRPDDRPEHRAPARGRLSSRGRRGGPPRRGPPRPRGPIRSPTATSLRSSFGTTSSCRATSFPAWRPPPAAPSASPADARASRTSPPITTTIGVSGGT